MIVQEIIDQLENLAPLDYAEEWDNVGLLVGNNEAKVTGVLVTLDTLTEVIDEAINKKCNLIISFHPIIYKAIKSISGKNYVQKVVQKAIENKIAIFSIHTALDNSFHGVNSVICEKLELKNRSILIPKKGTIKKLTTYVPAKDAGNIRDKIFEAGGGNIGNYLNCSFSSAGIGSFQGNDNSNPVIGNPMEMQYVDETKIEITFAKHLEYEIIKALKKCHPYDEIAYEIKTIDNENQSIGMGMVGELDKAIEEEEFLNYTKERMNCNVIKHSNFLNKKIKKVAVLGGSGGFAIEDAKSNKVDAYITSDLKYHDFFVAENQILLIDIGHYESEQFTKNLLTEYLKKKIPNFAILLSEINTNPINYKHYG